MGPSVAATPALTVVLDDLGHGPQISRLEAGDLAIDFAPAPLFRLNLRSIATGLITPIEPGCCEVVLPEAAAIENGMEIKWLLCGPLSRNLINVAVRIEVIGDQVDLSIRVEAKIPQHSVYEVIFPILRVRPIGDPASNVLAMPFLGGRILRDPIRGAAPVNFERPIEYLYFATMQFFGYYAPDGPLLYIQSTDGDAYPKTFEWVGEPPSPGATDPGATRFQTTHYPVDNSFEGNGVRTAAAYDMPYRMRLALTRGNWYEAARRYRAWALQQKWMARGAIEASPDFPESFRTLDVGLLRSRAVQDEIIEDFEIYLEDARRLGEFFETRRVMMLWLNWHRHPFDTSWPNYTARPAAIEAVARARAEGFLVMLYTFMNLWDLNSHAFQAFDGPARCAKDDWGNLRLFLIEYTNATFSPLNFSRESTRAVVLDIWRRLQSELPSDGYLLDVFGGPPTLDQDRSLPESGGSPRWQEGKRAFATLLRDTFKRRVGSELLNPNFGFVMEFGDETLLDLVDVNGNWSDIRPFRDAIPMPFYETVFHGYQLTAETLVPRPGQEHLREPEEIATAYHAGRLLAFVSVEPNRTLLAKPFEDTVQFELWDFMRALVAFNDVTRRFQRFGERLRALTGSVEDLLDRGPVADVSVQSSVWLSGGEIGILITNTAEEPRSFMIEVAAPEYPVAGTVGLVERGADGSYELRGLFAAAIAQEITIGPRSLVVLEILPAAKAIELTVGDPLLQLGPLSLTVDNGAGISSAELATAGWQVPTPGPFTFETLLVQLETFVTLQLVVETGNDGATWAVAKEGPTLEAPGVFLLTADSIPGAWVRLRYVFTYSVDILTPATTVFFARLPERLVAPQPAG